MASPSDSDPSRRLVSVDAFRGLAILAMILVNNPGDWSTVYWPLLHAEWHGLTPTDLIFPFFLFIVGVAIVLALGRQTAAGVPPGQLTSKLLRRSAILFLLGLFLNGFPFGIFGPRSLVEVIDTWRIFGVLQRIAICYLVASLLYLYCRPRTLILTTLGSLIGYWGLVTLVPIPGIGAPDLATRGQHLPGWVDRLVLGDHLWAGGQVYDPEGVLSTLPAIATTLLGVWVGQLLVASLDPPEKTVEMFRRGWWMVLLGIVWSWVFPLNKALWTSSYVLLTAGIACTGLALFHWRLDVQGTTRLASPLVLCGVNAITVFVGSGILGRTLVYATIDGVPLKTLIYDQLFASLLPPHAASLAYALAWVVGWYFLLRWMYRRNLVLKI